MADYTSSFPASGTPGNVLTENAAGVAPTFQPTGAGGATTRITAAAASYAVLSTDSVIVVKRASATALTVGLPAATGSGRVLTVKRHVGDLSASLTLDASGAELIDGSTTLVFSPAAVAPSATVKDDVAGEWIII
jgi:hypothetical protein